jgi:cell division septum initiation protein DivIVA
MAKKDKKSSKKGREPADVVEAVRGAVERTFQATGESTGDRGRSLLDDVASAAQRIRESFEDLRVLEDVKGLRAEVEALSRRVAELEKQQAAAAKPAASSTRSTARKTAGTSARSTARKTAGTSGRSTARKAPAKPSAARTAARTTGSAPKPAPATRRRKAAGGS